MALRRLALGTLLAFAMCAPAMAETIIMPAMGQWTLPLNANTATDTPLMQPARTVLIAFISCRLVMPIRPSAESIKMPIPAPK